MNHNSKQKLSFEVLKLIENQKKKSRCDAAEFFMHKQSTFRFDTSTVNDSFKAERFSSSGKL